MCGIYKPRADKYDHRLLSDGRYMYRVWDADGSEYQIIYIVPGEDAAEDVLAALAAMDTEERLDDRHQDEVADFAFGEDELKDIPDESSDPEYILFGEEQLNGQEMVRLVEAIGKLTPAQIIRLFWLLEPDPETGEIPMNWEELEAQMQSLQMEKKRILEYLAKLVLNSRAEQNALKEEEKRLHERRTLLEKKEERLMVILDRECAGENADLGVASLRYRSSTRTEVMDNAKAVRWLKRKKLLDCFKIPEPLVNKAAVKQLLKDGMKVPGTMLVESRSATLK